MIRTLSAGTFRAWAICCFKGKGVWAPAQTVTLPPSICAVAEWVSRAAWAT